MRWLTKIAGAVAIMVLFATAAVIWSVATPGGSRWLLESAIPLSGIHFTATKIEGTVMDQLLLTGVTIGMAEQKIEIDTLKLRWKPLLLLAGTIAIQELVAEGAHIQDDSPPDNKPLDLTWPKASAQTQLLDAMIGRFRVTDLRYRRLQEQPFQVAQIDCSLTWQEGILSIANLKGTSSSGQVNGSISAGFNRPSLIADLSIALPEPLAKMNRFRLLSEKTGVKGDEPFVGMITITGSADTQKLLELSGDIGMVAKTINLRRLRLTKAEQRGIITADGSLDFTTREAVLTLQLKVAGLDLAPDLNVPTDLSGTLKFVGNLSSYRGDFTLANSAKNWQAATLSAAYTGTLEGLKLSPLQGTALDGTLAGNLDIDWRNGLALQGNMSGRGLNPARVAPEWQGVANFDTSGSFSSSENTPLHGSISGILLKSSLHGQPLTGRLQADFVADNLTIKALELHGKGFDVQASGELKRRLEVAAQISDFSLLLPGSAGTLQTQGWLRRRNGQSSGSVIGTGSGLAYAGATISTVKLNAHLDEGGGYPLHAVATLRNIAYDGYTSDSVAIAADGTLQHHTLNAKVRSDGSHAQLKILAGYNAGLWKGFISTLSGSDTNGAWRMAAPAAFSVSADKISLSPLVITAGREEHLDVAADLALQPLTGQIRAQWGGVNLARANNYLKNTKLSGSSLGAFKLGLLPEKRLTLSGSASWSGTFAGQGQSMTVKQSLMTFDGGEKGVRVNIDLTTADSGGLKGSFSSPEPFRLAVPERGKLTAKLSGINLALFKPWLPSDTLLKGRISGLASGTMLPGQRFEMDGTAEIAGGGVQQPLSGGQLNLSFLSATASWHWRGEQLAGALALTMADHGQLRSNFQMPLPARFPVAVEPQGGIRGSLAGSFQEKGIISSLFPELVQESFGNLDVALAVSGSWNVPQIGGTLHLSEAGAYLPSAGIHLKDLGLKARLEKDLIHIDSFSALSGPGHIEGTAQLTLKGWKVAHYRGTLLGENFQTVNLPELQLLSTPQLTFEGTDRKLTVRGDLKLPELRILGSPSRTYIAPSEDIIREGAVIPEATSSPLTLDVQVQTSLGEQVFVKVAGIDAQLGGGVNISFTSLDSIRSKGEVKVIKGRYRTYGVSLDIVRGRLFFAGGPMDEPSLDVLALRTIGSVRAGVIVTGTLRKPVTRLYSEPAMPDVDVLAYIVLGHPLGSDGQQASLINQAAGALLTSGQAEVLQNQIKNKLGLSTFEIQGDVGKSNGAMGYKPLQVTAPGSIPAMQQPGITETMLTVGKFLTPQLYISYGRSLFTGSNLFLLRYDISKRWQVESQTGAESGVDLFYKLEFK